MKFSAILSSVSDTTSLPVLKALEGGYRKFLIALRESPGESSAPIDLSEMGDIYYMAKGSPESQELIVSTKATITDPPNGIIELELLPTEVNKPGLWWGAFELRAKGGWVLSQYPCRLFVEKSIASPWRTSPVTVSDIRAFLMDRCPEDNKLLMSTQFTDDMIINAMAWAVDDWNATPPTIATLNSANFPWRAPWINGTSALLLRTLAINQIRNNATFTPGTVTVNDSDKGPLFKQIGDQLYEEWHNWVMAKKRELNISMGWGRMFRPEF